MSLAATLQPRKLFACELLSGCDALRVLAVCLTSPRCKLVSALRSHPWFSADKLAAGVGACVTQMGVSVKLPPTGSIRCVARDDTLQRWYAWDSKQTLHMRSTLSGASTDWQSIAQLPGMFFQPSRMMIHPLTRRIHLLVNNVRRLEHYALDPVTFRWSHVDWLDYGARSVTDTFRRAENVWEMTAEAAVRKYEQEHGMFAGDYPRTWAITTPTEERKLSAMTFAGDPHPPLQMWINPAKTHVYCLNSQGTILQVCEWAPFSK